MRSQSQRSFIEWCGRNIRGESATLIGNVIRHNAGSAISINVNSLNSLLVNDTGRSIGPIDLAGNFYMNVGPLVTGNMLEDNDINGMEVRGGTLTTQSVWDDTDIVRVVRSEIIDANFSPSGGLRLQSRVGQTAWSSNYLARLRACCFGIAT